jgi:hypothetical protein
MVKGGKNSLRDLKLSGELPTSHPTAAGSFTLTSPLRGNTKFLAIIFSTMIFALIFDNTVFAQLSPFSRPAKIEVKIVSPKNDESKSTLETLLINGTSSDTGITDCHVQVIANNIKPYQNANPAGLGGNNDYSKWTFLLNSNYTSLKEGLNKITAKLDCPNALPSGMTKWYSVNVTGTR